MLQFSVPEEAKPGMAMSKAEMEAHWNEYKALVSRARSLREAGMHREAIELAVSSWLHIEGMMQYDRKYSGDQGVSIEAIEVVLACSPFLLDYSSLDALETLLSSQRRISKASSKDLVEELATARRVMGSARKLWNHLELQTEWSEDQLLVALGGQPSQWRILLETWEQMGLLRRILNTGTARWALATQMGELVFAKCPSCAAVVKGEKAAFLKNAACPKCRKQVLFVLLSPDYRSDK